MRYQVCAHWASSFVVPASTVSAGSGVDSYMVKFFPTQKAVCTCPAYRYSGEYDEQTCKHIRRVKQFGCFWMEVSDDAIRNMMTSGHNRLDDAGIKLFSTTKEGIVEDDECPSCGGPLLEVFTS